MRKREKLRRAVQALILTFIIFIRFSYNKYR